MRQDSAVSHETGMHERRGERYNYLCQKRTRADASCVRSSVLQEKGSACAGGPAVASLRQGLLDKLDLMACPSDCLCDGSENSEGRRGGVELQSTLAKRSKSGSWSGVWFLLLSAPGVAHHMFEVIIDQLQALCWRISRNQPPRLLLSSYLALNCNSG
jgi:hypothetical protein